MTDVFLMGWEELIGRVGDEEMGALFEGAVREVRGGVGVDMERVCVVGRKG